MYMRSIPDKYKFFKAAKQSLSDEAESVSNLKLMKREKTESDKKNFLPFKITTRLTF